MTGSGGGGGGGGVGGGGAAASLTSEADLYSIANTTFPSATCLHEIKLTPMLPRIKVQLNSSVWHCGHVVSCTYNLIHHLKY